MASLYLGVRLPEKPFKRLKLTNVDLITKNVADLKKEAEKLLNFPHNELVFIYCGTVLENDNQTLDGYKVRAETMIQVFPKQHDMEYKSEPATNDQINAAVSSYRAIFKEIANSSATKTIRPEIMKQILEAYPEFHTNLGAYAILRDSILIQSMTDYETAKTIAKQYPILVHSAEFVAKLLRENLASNTPNLIQSVQPAEDSMSDSSSSSESDSPMVASNQRSGDIRQISRDQLTQALLLAGSASTNSLSNIAQRNQSQTSTSSLQSTSSAPSVAAAPSSASLISSSMFTNALSQALSQAGTGATPSTQSTSAQPNPTPSAPNQPNVPGSNENLAERYATELQTMREMGLFEEMVNIQALAISNGDVEAAINLVLSGLGSFN